MSSESSDESPGTAQDIDHAYTSKPVCPHCGHERDDTCELQSEDPAEVECEACDKEYRVFCNIEISFCTETFDREAEAVEKAKRQAETDARIAVRYAACQQWLPGTRVRVKDDARAVRARGKVGAVANKEIYKFNPFIRVVLDDAPPRFMMYFFAPRELERL